MKFADPTEPDRKSGSRQRFQNFAFNDKLLPALGGRFNFTETVRYPALITPSGQYCNFHEGPYV